MTSSLHWSRESHVIDRKNYIVGTSAVDRRRAERPRDLSVTSRRLSPIDYNYWRVRGLTDQLNVTITKRIGPGQSKSIVEIADTWTLFLGA